MQIIGRSVGAALAMGNACVLKPAEDACLTALAFARLAQDAGLPTGALNVVTGLGDEAGAALCAHPDVDHISFTGSVSVGAHVQTAAAKNVAPVTLELGGKSPQLVFEDADLDQALPFLVSAGIQNAGQTCSASSRILVQRGLYDEVVYRMGAAYNALQVGEAWRDLDLGPLISARQKNTVDTFLAQGQDLRIAGQGKITNVPDGGHYVAPTLFADVPFDHPLARDEIFGPVQVLINNYGAGGGVELPFGGIGKSGHGREKGFEALYGFSQLKTVAAKHG
jgi:aldehyde dehydrogenase (NAD+)